MRQPRQKIIADSTLPELPRRQLRLKFFASLCLVAFLLGLMLGDVFKTQPVRIHNQLIQITVQEQGLKLCFGAVPQVRSGQTQGMYWLSFEQVLGTPASGQLLLSDNEERVSWRVTPQQEGLQLGLVALQPLQGAWQQLEEQPCIAVQVTTATQQ